MGHVADSGAKEPTISLAELADRAADGGPPPSGRAERVSFRRDEDASVLVSRARLHERIGPLRPRRSAAQRSTLIALLEGNPPQDLPEHLFTSAMRERGLVRHEFLGAAPGRWSLHRPYRCADFNARLPELVRRIERGEVPDAQRRNHDIADELVDWTEARVALAHNRPWHRLRRRR